MDLHSFPPFLIGMVLVSAVNILVSHLRGLWASARDRRRLVLALQAELTELLGVHEDNLKRLDADGKTLLSPRPLMAVYRASLQRVPAMPERLIGPLVHAYGSSERTECLIAGYTKPKTPASYQVVDDTPLGDIRFAIAGTIVAIRAALQASQVALRMPDEALDGDNPLATLLSGPAVTSERPLA